MTAGHLAMLDDIARKAYRGDYSCCDVLSTGERLYVALASGRMRELCPHDSIAYAVDRVGAEWMAHMLAEWRAVGQPLSAETVLAECAKYLKEGETVAERIQREIDDNAAVCRLLAQERREVKRLSHLLQERRNEGRVQDPPEQKQ